MKHQAPESELENRGHDVRASVASFARLSPDEVVRLVRRAGVKTTRIKAKKTRSPAARKAR